MPSSPVQPRASSPASEYRIFSGITYHLASSLPPTRAEELAFVLDAHGGQAADKELGVKDPKLTTVVSNSVRFEGWEVVAARMEGQGGGEGGNGDGKVVEVVTDKWVERSIVLGKLQSGSHFSADPSLIFSGVVACASDLPAADLEVLSAGITALGGQWRTGLTKDVTHLFALNPGSAKYATAMHYREETGIKVVLPHWFDDAVRLGMGGLDTRPYEWPEPALLRGPAPPGGDGKEKAKGKEKDIPDVEKDDVKRNMYATAALFTLSMNRSSPPTEADISLVNNGVPGNVNGSVNGTPGPSSIKSGVQVWTGRKILLSRTLQLYGNRREAVQKGIERAGGVVLRFEGDEEEDENTSGDWNVKLSRQEKVRRRHEAERVDECDIFVARWRWGKAYVQAVKAGKTIGTLAWLFHVQSTGILARPLDQLLHYPVPKRPIEGFSHHTITVTNYTGEAREYLKKLITAMGAHFTPSMSGQNTALIAAYISGTKANKALSWSIPVVNHTWLEDCFIQWRNLTVAREKYIVFPAGVDFSELLGERSLTAGASSGSGVANRIELEGEALEELVGEEGEEDAEEEEGALKAPNGTEGSAKEVARGLVDIDGDDDAVMTKPNSKPTSKPKSNGRAPIRPPPGMDIDFAPPSTALAAAEMDWEHSHMEDMVQDYNRQMSLPVEGGEEERLKSKATPKSKAKATPNAKTKESPRKPMHQPPKTTPKTKPKPKDAPIELEDSSEDEEVPKKTKGKGKKASEDEDSDEELPRAKSKAKGKSKAIESEEEDADEEPKAKSRSKPSPKSKSKSRAIELSDEEAPKAKSKAKAVASDYEEEEEEEAPKKTKGKGKAKVVDSDDEVEELAVKPRSKPTPKSKAKATESEDEPAAKSRPKPTRKGKSKAKATSESEEEEEEEEEPVVSKAPAKATPKGKVKAAEDSDEDDEEEEVRVKSKSRTKPSPKSKAKKFIDDAAYGEDEDEDEEDEEESTKAKSKSKNTSSPKSKSKTKAKAPTPTPSASETSEDEAPARKPTKAAAKASKSKPAPAKGKSKKTLPSSSSESESAVIVPAKQTKKLVRRFTGELGGAKVKGGDEEAEAEDARAKAKEVGGSGLLKTTRGDARTRVRKKKVVVEVESEEEEEPVVETKSKAKAKAVDKGKDKDAKGKKPVAVSSDEEEEPAPAKPKAKGKAKATAEKPKSKGGTTTPSSKPLRVYSTDEEVSDDEDETPATKKGRKAEPAEDEEDSDISFPDAPWQTAKAAKEKENTGPSSKAKKMKGKGKIASNEEEEEPAPVKKASTSRSRKATKEAAATAPPATALTPKRTVSVLMPSLSMSGKEREKRKRATEAFLAEQEEEHEEEGAGKKAKTTSKLKSKGANTNATTVAPKGKAAAAKAKNKAKSPIEPESEDEDEEAEVSILVSPSIRPKNLAKTDSLHAVAGHVVSSSVAKAAAKDKEKAKPNGRATKEKEKLETSISVSRKPTTSKPKSKSKAVPIEIDTSSAGAGPSTAGPSAFETESVVSTGPPKRSAAAKATQRLHDKLMPDLVNFEAQMKKSRGRKSAGGDMGLGSFAFDGDGDVKQEKDSGKRRKSEAVAADDEEKVRKKRRVSDENDEVDKEKTKGKGKQKAGVDKDGDVEMVDGDAAKPSKTAKGKKKEELEETASSGVILLTTQVTLSDEVLKALGKLGVKVTSRPSECTHLLAPHLVRTEKFLCALAVAPYVLTGQWAIASAAAKKLLPEKDFLLKDKAGESKYGVDLSLSLKRAKANVGRLLEGKTFYVTPRVPIDKKLLKSVVTACGGQVAPNQPTARVLAPSPDNRIVISCKEDISIWRPIRSAGYKVYTQELVLAGVLKQEMEWDREDFLVEG